jgi:hypothetical protein
MGEARREEERGTEKEGERGRRGDLSIPRTMICTI